MPVAMIGEASVDLNGAVLNLVMNNRAWIEFEALLDMSYLDALKYLILCEAEARSPKLSITGALVWASLRDRHADIPLDECYDLVKRYGAIVLAPLAEALRGSIRAKEPETGEAMPAKKPATQKRGAGKKL